MTFRNSLQNFHRNGWLILILSGVCLFSGCGKQIVATAENEFEANLMFDILHSNGFRVEKPRSEGEVKTWDVVIDEGWFGEDEAATAIQVLRDYGLPRPPEPEIKSTDSFGIASERAEKEKQKRDLQQQIERQLYNLPDVIRASIIVAQPVEDILSVEETPATTAAVLLVLKEVQPKFTVEMVQGQVSSAVPNLKPGNVQVSISQQSLREIPLEKLEAKRRSNAILVVGTGVATLLALALGAVLYVSKRRRENIGDDTRQLTEGETINEFDALNRSQLNSENE